MTQSRTPGRTRIGLLLCCMLLTVLLSACELFGIGNNNNNNEDQNTPTNSDDTPQIPSASLKNYDGQTFSISYPEDWHIDDQQNYPGQTESIGFNKQAMLAQFHIVVYPNPGGLLTEDQILDLAVETAKNQSGANEEDSNVVAERQVGGVTWKQRGLTAENGQGKLIILAHNYTQGSGEPKGYVIYYFAPTFTFDAVNEIAFNPMLESFQFKG